MIGIGDWQGGKRAGGGWEEEWKWKWKWEVLLVLLSYRLVLVVEGPDAAVFEHYSLVVRTLVV